MYRIRLHGRGGQGIKTAGRLLGTAFFREGFEVQDAPRYGAERRGAPIFAYVRASRSAINQRGIIRRPDLVIVVDDTLVTMPVAGVLAGVTPDTVLLIHSSKTGERWRQRLNFPGLVLGLPDGADPEHPLEPRFVGAACIGAAARLLGVIARPTLIQALQHELAPMGDTVMAHNLKAAINAYDLFADHTGCVQEGKDSPAIHYDKPAWIELPPEPVAVAAPAIQVTATSEALPTGLWRTVRPVIDYKRCHSCPWICGTLCPDSTINVNSEGFPEIDYQHCKGCLICLASCPHHAIQAIPEQEFNETVKGGGQRS